MDCSFQDLTGRRFERLLVIEKAFKNKRGQWYWLCKCDCGTLKTLSGNAIKRGTTKSCGCLNLEMIAERNFKHGFSRTKLIQVVYDIRDRCYNTKNKHYKDYGGRGINVCDEWVKDAGAFCRWSLASGYKEGLYIERIDNNGPYCPENCRWATMKEQGNNRRTNLLITYNGDTKTGKQWSEMIGCKKNAFYYRLKTWGIDRALILPLQVINNLPLKITSNNVEL